MWRIHANNTIKYKEQLEVNIDAMYEVVMLICDPALKEQVCNHKEQVCNHKDHEGIDDKQDMLGLLRIIKKTMYSKGDNDTHTGYKNVVSV